MNFIYPIIYKLQNNLANKMQLFFYWDKPIINMVVENLIIFIFLNWKISLLLKQIKSQMWVKFLKYIRWLEKWSTTKDLIILSTFIFILSIKYKSVTCIIFILR